MNADADNLVTQVMHDVTDNWNTSPYNASKRVIATAQVLFDMWANKDSMFETVNASIDELVISTACNDPMTGERGTLSLQASRSGPNVTGWLAVWSPDVDPHNGFAEGDGYSPATAVRVCLQQCVTFDVERAEDYADHATRESEYSYIN